MFGQLTILTYHRVLPEPDPLRPGDIDAMAFDGQMAMLAQKFRVLPLTEGIERLKQGALPARAVAITFDDGYADNCSAALPILQRHGLCATFFIASGYLNGGRMWNDTVIDAIKEAPGPVVDLRHAGLGECWIETMDKRRAVMESTIAAFKYLPPAERATRAVEMAERAGVKLNNKIMMTDMDVRRLAAAGMEIGGHTVSHPILKQIDDAAARSEIEHCREQLREISGTPVRLFAYPNGKPGRDYDERHVTMVRAAGFDGAVSTASGSARRRHDVFELPRFGPWDRHPRRFALRLWQQRVRSLAGLDA